MHYPLAGIRILDLSHVLAGPYASHFLAMMGAEVTKIERPGLGDSMRLKSVDSTYEDVPPGFAACNAAKRSLAVDIKTPQGREIIENLVKAHDVFIENFRPGRLETLGLGPSRLYAINPEIIYCSLSAWGQKGEKAHLGGYDHIIQAATGMMMMQGSSKQDPPEKVGFPVVDIAMGMMGALSIVSALLGKRNGVKDTIHLDVSMVDTALYLMASRTIQCMAGGEATRVGNKGFANSPGTNTFRTTDGWIATAANTLRQFESLCEVLGHPEYTTAPDYLHSLPKYSGAMLSNLATPLLMQSMTKAFIHRSSEEWEEELLQAGVPASRVNTLPEFLNGPYQQTAGINFLIPQTREEAEQLSILSAGFRWNGIALRVEAAAPRLGENSRQILTELGYSEEQIENLRRRSIIE